MQTKTSAARTLVAAPQRGKTAVGAVDSDGKGLQRLAAVGASAPDRAADARLFLELDGFAEESHGQASAGPRPEGQAKQLPHAPAITPVFVHLAIVLMLGLYIPPYLTRWFHEAARMLG